jgi:hypothetical protein
MVKHIATGRVTRWALIASAAGVALLAGVPIYDALVKRKVPDAPAALARASRCNPAVLASVESILAPPESGPDPDLDSLVAHIVDLGPSAITPLLALACGDAHVPEIVPGTTDGVVHPLAVELRGRTIEGSLARFTDDQFVPLAVKYADGDVALDVKLVIVRLLGARGAELGLPAVWATLDDVDPICFESATVQQSIEPALAALLQRDPQGIEAAGKHCRRELLPSLARAAGGIRSIKSLAWLANQLGHDETFDLTLLEELGRAGGGGRLAIPEPALRRVRDALAQSHGERRRVAAATLGQLRDDAAFDDLVRTLGDDDVSLVAAAHGALEALVGRDLGPDADAWHDWRVQQDAWNNHMAPSIYRQLSDTDPAFASSAIAELLTHPFFRRDVATALAARLPESDGSLFATTCTALTSLASERGTTGLVEALDRENREERETARRALCALTGLDLPADRATWIAALEP